LSLARAGGLADEPWGELLAATLMSALTGFVSVKWLLRYVATHNFNVFAGYRIALGVVLLAFL